MFGQTGGIHAYICGGSSKDDALTSAVLFIYFYYSRHESVSIRDWLGPKDTLSEGNGLGGTGDDNGHTSTDNDNCSPDNGSGNPRS